VPALFLTADATAQTATRLREAGGAGTLYKPVNLTGIRKALADVVLPAGAPAHVPSAPPAAEWPRPVRPVLKVVPISPLDAAVIEELRNVNTRPEFLGQLLSHADMRIRQKAQFDLVRRGESAALLAAARDRKGGYARLHGLWGLAQLARKEPAKASVFAEFLTDPDGEIRAQAARMIGDVKAASLAPKLLPLLMDTQPRARYFAAEAIARTGYKPAASAVARNA